jgi:hypothetical protein
VSEFDGLDREILKLSYRGVERAKLLAHLTYKLSEVLMESNIIVEVDENGTTTGLYIGNKNTARAFSDLCKKIHYTVKEEYGGSSQT